MTKKRRKSKGMSKRLIWVGELEGSCALLPSFLPSGLSVVSVDFNRGDHLPISDKDNHNDKMSDVSRQMFSQKKKKHWSWLFGLPLNNRLRRQSCKAGKTTRVKWGRGIKPAAEAGKTIVHFSFCHLCPLTTGDWGNANITPPGWVKNLRYWGKLLLAVAERRRPSMWPMVWGEKMHLCLFLSLYFWKTKKNWSLWRKASVRTAN